MAESTMQYLISLSDETIEKIMILGEKRRISRDTIITEAIYYYYQSNQEPVHRPEKVTPSMKDAASHVAMVILEQCLRDGRAIKIPSLGLTIGVREEE